MIYDPGRMRQQGTFYGTVRTPDGAGGYVETPAAAIALLTNVWLELDPIRGSERLRAMQISAEPSHTVRMWYSALVTSDMSLVVDGITYAVVSNPVSPDEERVLTEFLVRKEAAVV